MRCSCQNGAAEQPPLRVTLGKCGDPGTHQGHFQRTGQPGGDPGPVVRAGVGGQDGRPFRAVPGNGSAPARRPGRRRNPPPALPRHPWVFPALRQGPQMVLQIRQLQVRCRDGLVKVVHQVRFRHGRQLVQGSVVQAGVMAPVELLAGVGCAAQFLQSLVLVGSDPGGAPAVPSPPRGAQEQHPGDESDVHGAGGLSGFRPGPAARRHAPRWPRVFPAGEAGAA